ncbi:hypothetical protein KFD70_22040 [Bacillus pfraonensis]|uniref:hypothetical protein n=1 Tax=Bacillus pfraonensis TaxID=2830844 RepID=UPI003D6F0C79
MRKDIEKVISQLCEAATESNKYADEAFAKGDSGLSGYHKGQSEAFLCTALALSKVMLEDTLKNHEEMKEMKQMENSVYEITQLLAGAKETERNGN